MSSERFEDLEDELRSTLDSLEGVIKTRLPKISGEQRKSELRKAEKQMEDASSLLNNMMEETHGVPGAYRTKMLSTIRSYRYQLENVKKEINKASAQTPSGRSDLFGDFSDPSVAHKNRMLEGLDSLQKSSASVERSQRIAAETDEVGVQIIGDLEDQRESLLRTRDKVKQAHSDLGRSRRILNSMAIRLATNKVILVIIIFLELIILGAVVYIRFFKSKKK
ncbi:vesicle transport through interaction with t-SNAREs homolog 1B-like [Rhopilema esculentum]|uniref:vesicle transport through interaction with t-SNAREs homolog 1B-like n=1 Tax=Rhopilema esculentum TaxID=499914 RepID=UPI0031D67323